VRGVYERDPGSGVWWIQYKQGSVRKREKVGRRSDAIALYQQRKSEMLSHLDQQRPVFPMLAYRMAQRYAAEKKMAPRKVPHSVHSDQDQLPFEEAG
jgi:hypothetical protein